LPLFGFALLIFGITGVGLGQEISFEFDVSLDGDVSATHVFGLHAGALQGLDQYDIPAPPPSPSAPFFIYLAMMDPPAGLPNQWLHDLRPPEDLVNDRVELWQMGLASAPVGATCTIRITETQPGLAPYDLDFFGPGASFNKITVPGTFSFPVTSTDLDFFWELQLADQVAVESVSWGGVKSLYH